MPSISNLFHVAIKTNDLDATVRFYTEVLGLHKVARPDFGYPEPGSPLPAAQPSFTSMPEVRRSVPKAARPTAPPR
jgi:catechol 2,3-dioxygenase-like lactoylglutathione lyase family enzyme